MQIHVNASVLLLTHQVPLQIWACATIAACSPLGHPQNDIAVAVAWRRQAQSKTAIRVRLDDDRMTTASALPATASPQRATAADSLNASIKLRHRIQEIQTFTIFKFDCLARPLPPEIKSRLSRSQSGPPKDVYKNLGLSNKKNNRTLQQKTTRHSKKINRTLQKH